MAHIDYYFSTQSPFAYLATDRFLDLVQRSGASVTYKPLDIQALFARTGGQPLPERHPSRVAYRAQDLPRQARKLGLPFNLQPAYWPVNAAPASYAIIAAQQAGGGDRGALVSAVLRACFAEEKDISDDAVVQACLTGAGFDPGLSFSGLLTGAEIYAQNLEDAVSAGVFGSPFFVVENGQSFFGQDRLEDLEAHLTGAL